MRILSVTLVDYGAFAGRHVFPVYDQGLILVEGRNRDEPRMRSNGAGKTTLWDGLDWCLWGVIPRGEPVDSVIHDGCRSCSVETHLLDEDTGVSGVVTRSRPAGLRFQRGGENLTCQDTAETQKLIETWLGLDRDVFHSVCLYAQTDLLHFADSTDGGRMETLSKVLPELGEIDALEEPAKALRDVRQRKVDDVDRRLLEATGALQALRGLNYADQMRRWDVERAEKVTRLESQLVQIGPEMDRLHHLTLNLPAVESEVRDLDACAVEAPVPPSTPELDRHRAVAMQASADHGAALAEYTRLDRERVRMRNLQSGRCSQCGSVVTPEHVAYEVSRLDAACAAAHAAEVSYASVKASASAAIQTEEQQLRYLRQARDVRVHDAQSRLMDARRRLGDLQRVASEATRLSQMASQIQAAIQAGRSEVNPWVQEEQRRIGQMGAAESKVGSLQAERDAAAVEVAYAEFWVKAMGAKGLKSYVLDARLTELTDAANEWVKLLTGGTFWVRFESQKMSQKKKLSNAPSIRVFKYLPDGKVIERGYRSFSGGEKRRLAWAIDFGLSRLVARRALKKWDLLVLDEVFAHVDTAGGQALVEMLHALRREKSSIFVIEQDADFRSAFERVWTVEKRGGSSKLITEEQVHGREDITVGQFSNEAGRAQPEATAPGPRVPRRGAVRRRGEGGPAGKP